uniref:RNA binding protein 5 n=1 Tax=Echinococcus canadensis TaxID=519352 RepID=A0A915EXV6_9CEST
MNFWTMGDYEDFRARKTFVGAYRDSFEYNQVNTDSCESSSVSTLLFNDMPASVSERDLRYALDDEKVRFIDLRFMRDKSRCFAFVDFAPDEADNLIRSCRNEIKVRGFKVLFDYADPKDEALRFERGHVSDSRFSGNVEEPTSNIMVRGIPSDIDERDIIEELNRDNIRYADVRVIRDRLTGVSRGFGFIEFASTQEAIHWMDAQKGLLHVHRHTMRLNFSSPRNQPDSNRNETNHRESRFGNSHNFTPESLASGDWKCFRCSSHNFKRREICFRCQHPRSQAQPDASAYTSDGSDLVGTTPCNTLILRCLDAFTAESSIQAAFIDQHNVQIKRCYVLRDRNTNTSRCFAVAELPTVADAYKVVDTIMKEHKIFEIEGKAIAINYAKNNFNTIMATLKTEGALSEHVLASHSQPSSSLPNVIGYTTYAAGQISVAPPPLSTSGVAVAQAAIQMKQTEARLASIVAQSVHHPQGLLGYPPQQGGSAVRPQTYSSTLAGFPAPTMPFNALTAANTEYPFPDTTKFLYDETIRYYYDPLTGLLYEPNTRYFFDRATQQYYHYDASRSLYVPASQVVNQQNQSEGTKSIEEPIKKKEKKDKEKTAQKIAKEMEKWARRMNSQREAPVAVPKVEQATSEDCKTADMGYAILQAASNATISSGSPTITGLVAQYGGEDSEEDDVTQSDEKEVEAQVTAEESKLMDWTKLACLLCSRGFKDVETMQKHRVFSNLHLQNLNRLRSKFGLRELSALPAQQQQQSQKLETQTHAEAIESLMQLGAAAASSHARDVAASRHQPNSLGADPSPPYGSASGGRYRDRAKERREKFGTAPPSRFDHQDVSIKIPSPRPAVDAPSVLTSASPTASNGTVGGNVGSRLMEKMGWQAGQGLGKSNQGRTQLVEPEFREVGVGLGVKVSKRLPPADNYKDNVKRAMYARYHELG